MTASSHPTWPEPFDVAVIGGGPAGATVAHEIALQGKRVALLERGGRIKPCGGAIPPRLIRDFDIPEHLLVAKATSARIFSPSNRSVDMPIEGGFVGMVDRDTFDEWLRNRAAEAGAVRVTAVFDRIDREDGDLLSVRYRPARSEDEATLKARFVVGADGANSTVARQELRSGARAKHVFAYHEIIESPPSSDAFDGNRCDIYYQGELSPDFYAWVFPHGRTASIGVGSANKGFSLRNAVEQLRASTGLSDCTTVRVEGAPIPLKPMKKWDNGKDVIVVGDASGIVAPASGEGIYYAMLGGRYTAEAVLSYLTSGKSRDLAKARKRFMRQNGLVFWILGVMQYFWYSSDKRRERFVTMCADPDVQRLTWEAYMNKKLVFANPLGHIKIFFKDLGHLLGIGRAK